MDDFERNKHNEPVLGDDAVDEFGTDFELSDEAQQIAESLGQTSENPYEQVSDFGKSDQELLDEAGVSVDLDGTYDMARRDTYQNEDGEVVQGRDALARTLHNEMQGVFGEIAASNEEVVQVQADAYERVIEERGLSVPVSRPPAEVMVEGAAAINEKASEIEETVYNHLSFKGRFVGEEDIKEAVAGAVSQYHAEVDRYELGVSEEALDQLTGEDASYQDDPLNS